MGRKTPQVVEGLRKPTDRSGVSEISTEPVAAYREARDAGTVPAPPGVVVYHSLARRARIQLTAPLDRIDPISGAITRFPALAVQFEDGEYRTSNPEIIARLEAHRNYGLTKNFWRADAMRAETLKKTADSLAQAVRATADPEMARRLIAELAPIAGTDFQLPTREPEADQPAVEQ